jgi:transcriptional regulator with XRE-family HTH domain
MDAVDRIFALVEQKYKEQKAFAAEIGVAPSKVSEWKKRKAQSYTRYLPQIAAALDTTAEYILTGKEEKSPAPEGDERPECWDLLTREEREKAREYIEMLIAARGKR